MKRLLIVSTAYGMLAGAAFMADAQTALDGAREGESKQGQIQADAKNLVAQLDSTIDEYQRNGLTGDEIKNLKALRDIMSKLSDEDMKKIVEILQQATAKGDPANALKSIAAAYAAQKGVLTKLKSVLDANARNQEAIELSNRVKDLAERQAANLQTGIETAQWSLTNGKKDDAAAAASTEGQASEQKAIADELKQLQAKIDEFAKNPNNKAMAERFKKGLEDSAKVAPLLNNASDLLDRKKLFEAVANEKAARDQMRQLARTIAPPREDADALRNAMEQIEKIISQQKDLITITSSAVTKSFEEWLGNQFKQKKGPTYDEAKKDGFLNTPLSQLIHEEFYVKKYGGYLNQCTSVLPGLENQQGDLVNQSDSLSQDISKTAKSASDSLQTAIQPMQTARGAITDKAAASAVKSENEALVLLEKAKADLEQKLAAAEKTDKPSDDPVANLTDLQKKAQALLADQAALAKDTAAPKTPQQAAAAAQQQSALQQKAQELQQKAATDAPAAAQTLAKAADNMKQAADAMNNAAPNAQAQAQAQQAQAMDNLAKAGQQLAQQAAQTQQAQQEVAKDQKALAALAKIIEAEQKLQLDTVQAAATQQKKPEPVRALATTQHSIKQDTEDFQKTLVSTDAKQPANPAGAQLADSASHHMGDAFAQLSKADGLTAQPHEQKALADLYALQNNLQNAMQAAQAQLGTEAQQQDAQAAQNAAQAAAAIAQAQAQVSQAMDALNQQQQGQQADQQSGQPQQGQQSNQQTAGQLAQAADETGKAAAESGGLPDSAQKALQDATQALTDAAGQEAGGKNAQAKGSAQAAQAALAQAAAALSQAQNGIASGPPSPDTPGNTPGAKPGPPTGKGNDDKGSTQIDGVQSGGKRVASKLGFLSLPQRDRATIQQSQSEKYPQEYAARVEQYLQNLADGNYNKQ